MRRLWFLLLVVASCSSDDDDKKAATGGTGGTSGAAAAAGADAGATGGAAGSTGGTSGSGAGGVSGSSGSATGGAGGNAGSDAGGSSGSAGADAGSDACKPLSCDGWICGTVQDGCGGTISCNCTGPYTCITGTCTEVAASYCAAGCESQFPTLVQTIPNTPCGDCNNGGGVNSICTKPGIAMTIVKDKCPAGQHFTQAFQDCAGVWWFPCIPN